MKQASRYCMMPGTTYLLDPRQMWYTLTTVRLSEVLHHRLLHKLQNSHHVPDKAFAWLKSCLTGGSGWLWRASAHNGRTCDPEGGILSPLLFVCFINDLPLAIQTDPLLFADDVKLYCRVDSDIDVAHLHHQLGVLDVLWCTGQRPGAWLWTHWSARVWHCHVRHKPIVGTYTIGGVALERVPVMKDFWASWRKVNFRRSRGFDHV